MLQAFNMVAQRDSKATLLLTQMTATDGRAMKQIAVLTAMFLPATFVAVCRFHGRDRFQKADYSTRHSSARCSSTFPVGTWSREEV